jgi:hypothetical protein
VGRVKACVYDTRHGGGTRTRTVSYTHTHIYMHTHRVNPRIHIGARRKQRVQVADRTWLPASLSAPARLRALRPASLRMAASSCDGWQAGAKKEL